MDSSIVGWTTSIVKELLRPEDQDRKTQRYAIFLDTEISI